MAVLDLVTAAVGGFLVGSLSPAVWIARAFGRDVRASGSGNPGATNAGRVLGVRWGVVVALLDVAKGALPVWAAVRWAGVDAGMVAAVATVLGHIFSPFLRGRGGKGAASAAGAILVLAPWLALVAVGVFLGAVALLRRFGEAAAATCAVLVVVGVLAAVWAWPVVSPARTGWCVAILAGIVLLRHRRNVQVAWTRRRPPPLPDA